MRRFIIHYLLLLMLTLISRATSAAPPLGIEDLKKIPTDSPIIYDNDWLLDTTDDEYLFAKASLRDANLVGIVLTKDSWDNGKLYSVRQGLDDFEADLAIAKQSGVRNLPRISVGADRELTKPGSGVIAETSPIRSEGTDLIVREAGRATEMKPLVVIVGGPLITVASAYLTDPSIADKMIVLMTDIDGYNGSDPWANFIVATKCKLANFGAGRIWWPQPPNPSVMPIERFDKLPDNPLTRETKRVATMFRERSTRSQKPDRDDGFGDGAGTFLIFKPQSWIGVKKIRVAASWMHEDVSDESPYHYLDVTDIDTKLMSEEFFAVLGDKRVYETRASIRNSSKTRFPVRVSENKRYLIDQYDKPFFYLGDTAWELFHRLDLKDAETYLRDRADKRFNVIQAVVLAEHGGLDIPNANGHLPLENKDPRRRVEAYFEHVDRIVAKADELGLTIGMAPTWGSWWHDGAGIFTPESAYDYGLFLGKRYRDRPIIWILGGDRPIENDRHQAIIRATAKGLREGDGGRHLMTFHPPGGAGSANWFHNDDWLAFNMRQTGHGRDHDNYAKIAEDYRRTPVKPCIDGEPGYEDHPAEFNPKNGYLTDNDIRKFIYWSTFAGAAGHTYGCHDIWQFFDASKKPPVTAARTPWRKALDLPGAGQMRFARELIESRPFLDRIPDQSLVVSGPGGRANHVQATRDANGTFAFIYIPMGDSVVIDLEKLKGKTIRAYWFDPKTGSARRAETFPRIGKREFVPPVHGAGNDRVLILDDADAGYSPPGTIEN